MRPNELDFMMVNLYTRETPAHIYRTKNHDDVEVLYYTPDAQLLLEKGIYAPIYYHKGDIPRLPLEEKKTSPCGIVEKALIYSISEHMRLLPENEKMWCLTNAMRYGGALDFYQLPVLKEFCNSRGYPQLLIGAGNRDYAYILKDLPKNQGNMEYLLKKCPDIMDNNGTLEQTYLFTYDNEADKLIRIS